MKEHTKQLALVAASHDTQQTTHSNITEDQLSNMTIKDKTFVLDLMSKYANTGTEVSLEDRMACDSLIAKYAIKISRNPLKMISRFTKIRKNVKGEDGVIKPYVRTSVKPISRKVARKSSIVEKKEAAKFKAQLKRQNKKN